MHALGRFIQEQMDEPGRAWKAADLARQSGLSPQVISKLLDGGRTRMARPPSQATVTGLAKAFGGADIERRLWLRVAESMGLPAGMEIPVADPARLTDEDLLRELARRLAAASTRTGERPLSVVRPGSMSRSTAVADINDFDIEAASESTEKAGQPQVDQP